MDILSTFSCTVSDHLLTVLGRLNTQAALRQRRKLIDNFCKVYIKKNHVYLVKTHCKLKADEVVPKSYCIYNYVCFVQAVVGEVANRTGGDICRMSVLIFFACRPGDVEMQTHTNTHGVSTTQSDAECDFEFLSEGKYTVEPLIQDAPEIRTSR